MTNQIEITVAEEPQVTVEVSTLDATTLELSAPTLPAIIELVTPGPQGPPGADLATFTYYQASPSNSWVINHNLGYKPAVTILNTGSQEIEGDIVHTSINQVLVGFTTPTAGLARLI